MNHHHRALARWNLAVKATENALKRLLTIGSSNCNNETYVTTQLENADEYLCQALAHIRSFATDPKVKKLEAIRREFAPSPEEELARTFVPSAMPPRPPKEHVSVPRDTFEGAFPSHDGNCECSQCKGGVRYE